MGDAPFVVVGCVYQQGGFKQKTGDLAVARIELCGAWNRASAALVSGDAISAKEVFSFEQIHRPEVYKSKHRWAIRPHSTQLHVYHQKTGGLYRYRRGWFNKRLHCDSHDSHQNNKGHYRLRLYRPRGYGHDQRHQYHG